MDILKQLQTELEIARCLEIGKRKIQSGDDSEIGDGVRLILHAANMGSAEASFLVARLILDGMICMHSEDSEETALSYLCRAADKGNVQARALLNAHCMERYNEAFRPQDAPSYDGPLVDFDGKPIRINRQGVLTPIDAVLTYENGVNRLTLQTNIAFYDINDDVPNHKEFEKAVLAGIMDWQGEYRVFGNQRLQVVMDVTTQSRLLDNLIVIPLGDSCGEEVRRIVSSIATGKKKERTIDLVDHKRSFMTGRKWTSRSRKFIFIQSENGKFDDYEEIRHVCKHEFGHALGLGDLYESGIDELPGVDKGTYRELDGFHISRKLYNLVMCDHRGPISNNDIEMVVLAFRENKAQLYQPGLFRGKISTALGKGN